MPQPPEGPSLDLLATTTFGLEAVAARELHDLGYADAKPVSTGRVLFRGGPHAVARANIHLRTADRVLVRVGDFPAPDFGELFDRTNALEWERWIPRDFAFPVDGRSVRSKLSSVPACQRLVKKAIVERLRKAHGVESLPETGPTVAVEVALLKDHATLTIDTSGVGLHKRGYRTAPGEAALKETLAAGLVLLSNWRPSRPLIDPFCGTGTIAIEAALRGRNMAPGLGRGFDAEHWPAIPPQVWRDARQAAHAAVLPSLPVTIFASDIDEGALGFARQAAAAAGVERDVHFQRRDVRDLSSKAEYGVIITNPPYGVRLGDEPEIDALYRDLPAIFRRLPTWSFHVLTARLDLERLFGQEATRRRKLYNSRIECTYFSFLGPKPPDMIRDRDEREPSNAEDAEAEQRKRDSAGQDGSTQVRSPPLAHPPSSPSLSAPPPRPPGSPPAAFGGLRERDLREFAQFEARLAKNVRHLRRYPARGVTCYRLYERDCPDTPLIIDRYEDRVHVSEYEREHSRTAAQQADWLDHARSVIARVCDLPPSHVFIKEKHRQRGHSQHEKLGDAHATRVVHEGGLKFEINLSDYADTGLFLDHRLTRAMVREQAAGTRFLNLFCYTGAFTIYAAAGGAAATTSVDLSNTYLDWTRRNLALNGLWPGPHALVKSDVLPFLAQHPRGPCYDLAVVDPPTYSRSKSTQKDWDLQHDQADLFRALFPLIAPGGVVYFSNNFRRFRLDEGVLAELGVMVREITGQTIPPEYRNPRVHRCWRLTAPNATSRTSA
jgi:23S rRNA (guanine2445-N2)-methyltransferase / 23S rRNA (guanine2069-N7)-methyltransferase